MNILSQLNKIIHVYTYINTIANKMNKTLFTLLILILFWIVTTPAVSAQTQTAPNTEVVLDAKTQAKVDKIRVSLAKNQQKLNKEMASYEKAKAKYDKDMTSGKLSPRDKEKAEKGFTRDNVQIGKLKQKIADDEASLQKYNLK